jgi:hypothetical protein
MSEESSNNYIITNKQMKKINLFLLSALAFLAGAGLQAQVTIGGLAYPTAGAILDLNSPGGAKGGLVLSSVNITSLGSIPEGTDYFPGVDDSESRDFNQQLRGAIVYNINPATVPGVYVWTGKRWMPFGETEDQILFTIHTDDGGYIIPTSSDLNKGNHDYDWDITVDGQPAAGGDNGRFQGTGNKTSDGISLSNLSDGDHQIRITSHGSEEPGWGNAFGHYQTIDANANSIANMGKLISIDAPLSTLAFAPKTTESTDSAAYMFAFLFYGCTNLTTPAVIRDNYKLPATITCLSGFLSYTHVDNDSLKQPIDLTPLKDWFTNNTTITNLTHFLSNTHYDNNSLTAPIDLTPLKNWFSGNRQITVSHFLYNTHYNNNSLTLSGQTIFPNWVKTIATNIQNVQGAFERTFYLNAEKTDDSAEPQFEDNTSLSSLGNPNSMGNTSKETYTNRTSITSLNIGDHWK